MISHKMYLILSLCFIFMLYISVAFSFEAAFVRNNSGTSVSEALDLPSNYPALPGDFSQHTRDFQELFYVIMEDAKLNRMAQNSSTPTYMLDLYKSIKGPTASIRPTELEASVIRDSDTVRSFLPQVSEFEESQGRFSFDLSVIEPEEDIRLCELRIANKNFKWSSQNNIRVSIYQTCREVCEDPADSEVCTSSTRISSLTLPLTEDAAEKQVVFDVTRSVRYALQIERSEFCTLEIILSNDEELDDSKSIDRRRREILGRVDITSGRFIPADSPTAKQKKTDNVVLVVFTRGIKPKNVLNDAKVREPGESLQVEADMRRMRRDAKEDRKRKKERERNKEKKQQREKERADKLASELTIPTCRKVSFQINFDHIGWSRWIIYPTEFEAFRCEGSCAGPMKPHHNPSNHAVMQSLVNLKRPDLAPEVCCVPTKLVPLSMLYFEHGSIALKHHAEMIVTECGCR